MLCRLQAATEDERLAARQRPWILGRGRSKDSCAWAIKRDESTARLTGAADYIMALQKAKHKTAEWQAAAEALRMAAENCGPLMHAHIGMLKRKH
jgi:hypothetical protein